MGDKTEMSQWALAAPLGVSGSILSWWLLFHMAAWTNSFSTSTENRKGHLVSQFKGKEEVGYEHTLLKEKNVVN